MNSDAKNSNSERACNRCGKAKSQGSGGSITQWISGCKCAELTELHELQQTTPRICATCGKSIQAGRPGSLTQWVFRQDICSCHVGGMGFPGQADGVESPGQLEEAPASSGNFDGELDTAGGATYDDVEISVDENRFPIQRYSPLSELGRGAAGTVYLCRDRLLGQKVAVKCLNHVSAERLLSFQLEAKATSKLTHQNIVKVINFDVTDSGSPYMVMEYFPSVSLADLIAENGGLAWNELVGIIQQVIDGLEYAHQHDIFHRDLKPSNILLQQSASGPRIRIIDFGVALVSTASMESTIIQGRTLVGTPEYMSPDQASGIAYDVRSEIYSLGCLMFETATGRPPFHGQSALELINHHARTIPPLVSELSEHRFPSGVDELVASMLEKNPDNRPQTLEAVRNRLTGVDQELVHSSIESQPATDTRWKLGLIAGSLLALLLLVIAVSYLTPKKSNQDTTRRKIDANFDRFSPTNFSSPEKYALRKFTVESVELDEPGRSIPMLTRRGDELITDDDLKYISYVMGPDCDGIDLASFVGVKGEGIKYLRDLKVQSINLQGMRIAPIGYKYLSQIPALREVVCDSTNITDENLKNFENHSSIYSLSLSKCYGISDKALHTVATVPHLAKLDLTLTKMTDEGLKAVCNCPKLRRFYLEGTEIGDAGLMNLKPCPGLIDLRLVQCKNVTGNGLRFVMKTWPKLTFLEIGGDTTITSSDLECLRNSKLNGLNIVGVPITDRAMQVIGTISRLKEVHFSKGSFSSDSLKYFYPLSNLRTITLMGCKNISRESIAELRRQLNKECNIICPVGDTQLHDTFKDMYSTEGKMNDLDQF